MAINRVCISGNMTRDPELRQTASGNPVLGFGVAVNDRRKNNQTGEWEDYPNFVDCTMFGQRAQAISGYLRKGTKVSIEGKLHYSSWERDGQKRSKLEVLVDEIEFMTPPAQQQVRQQPMQQPVQQPVQPPMQQPQPTVNQGYLAQQQEYVAASPYDEDLPW